MIYGYAQLSTDGQSVGSQMEQLRAAGVEKVYREKRGGGARADRVQLRRVLAELGKGDVLFPPMLELFKKPPNCRDHTLIDFAGGSSTSNHSSYVKSSKPLNNGTGGSSFGARISL
jgi:Resolvase, N terminal domain